LLIAATTCVVLAGGVFHALVATPIYESDAVLQVEKKSNAMGDLDDITTLLTGENEAETEIEIEIIRSRAVLGATVDRLHLDIIARPRYFPLIGKAIARRRKADQGLAEAPWGLDRFAWGGERIRVDALQLPASLQDQNLRLVAGKNAEFQLFGPDNELLLNGRVGQVASTSPSLPTVPASDTRPSLLVSELRARSGTEFILVKRLWTKVIADLQQNLQVEEKGKQTGIIKVTWNGDQSTLITATVNTIAETYLRQNIVRKSEEAEKMLSFLSSRLPTIKTDLSAAEAAISDHLQKSGSIDLSAELSLTGKALLDQSAEIERQIAGLGLKRAGLRQKFTDNHPLLVGLQQKVERLENQRAAVTAQMNKLPATELESVRLMRDVEVNKEIYLQLLGKMQELSVAKAGTIGNVRIVDRAVEPDEPIRPKKVLVVALSPVLGLMLGMLAALARRALNPGVEDPDLIEERLGVPVYAVIPHSDTQDRLFRRIKQNVKQKRRVLALQNPNDIAVESLRSLRTSLQLVLMEASNNILAISGPAPGTGKSFVSVNLAHVLADTGKRVLLIDGDMRRGFLHDYLAVPRSPGLSELISGEAELQEAVRPLEGGMVSFLATGAPPPNPSELLASERVQRLLQTLSDQYNLILIDTPPVMAVTDAVIIGRLAGTNFLVLRAGRHPFKEISTTIKRFEQGGGRIQGMIVNDMLRRHSSYGYGKYGHYHYDYNKHRGTNVV
jgi:tyrosine-protein kinase Etk/Wzc